MSIGECVVPCQSASGLLCNANRLVGSCDMSVGEWVVVTCQSASGLLCNVNR